MNKTKLVSTKELIILFSLVFQLPVLSSNAQAACPNINCSNISASTWTHIQNSYCNNPCVDGGSSAFNSTHCLSLEKITELCNSIVAADNCNEVPLRGGRIMGTSTLIDDLGYLGNNACAATNKSSIVYQTSFDQVLTIFPGP
ncbi:hypothetical protein KCM76_04095 [Zooshikella marina]|uniref:Uncharacterized protein n=1 Tax=Zooshikella ganghwensis TaxID=202772 RepID=A0A4P9VQE3_9GAMM|nr:hypothetical protein [Zooshikella ganghwensis]MBU2705148.1 hypothetical protein [Zooshikella ganghwensis]RDH44280.1 hypothetical protein B9G39_12950 [Zooshikella ganghwensis]